MIFANIELYPTFSRPAIFVFQACILFCAFCIKLGRRSKFFCLFFVKLAGPDTSDTPAMRTRIPRLRQKRSRKIPKKVFMFITKSYVAYTVAATGLASRSIGCRLLCKRIRTIQA